MTASAYRQLLAMLTMLIAVRMLHTRAAELVSPEERQCT